MRSTIQRAAVAVLVLLLGACASRPPSQPVPPPQGYYGVQYGVVQDIAPVRVDGRTTGAGAVIGGVVGGVVGRQIDRDGNRDLATGVGVIGGAIIGNEIEKRSRSDHQIYRVTVRLDHGAYRSFDYEELHGLRIGNRVRVENGQLYRF
ncbi:glycine zipper 2TM domain-containing protein [Piscinibacter sp.]|uniref:glycine zipper 2TM domain-containing protein n=1 Tax=Piscinibacter sp. TaxID=1903157 RepID=UPI002C5443E4|nr:glycine zipper 2TM domain-containing protein [Albitalea sp.]HUG25795.1 glycine zipper 2TM domain-containing protein [Albitalea sp.]